MATRLAGAQISGVALTMILSGSVLVLSGLNNAPVADTLRSLIRGEPLPFVPAGNPGAAPGSTQRLQPLGGGAGGDTAMFEANGTPLGRDIAADARKYLGVPYKWGGEEPTGWDCSGFVTYVLHHDFGIQLPDNTHTTAAGFYAWAGAETLSRHSCAPGDLVCWPSHVGIATGPNTFINAPTFGQKTREEKIWAVPVATIRRPYAYG